ncbi:unnamed protein product [Merluccius merluccius]
MFNFLKKHIDEEEKKNHSNSVDITFVAHGAIRDSKIPASCLLPLSAITDVLLYSPWNCTMDFDAVNKQKASSRASVTSSGLKKTFLDSISCTLISLLQFSGFRLEDQQDTETSIMATADELLEQMFSWMEQRELCAEQLKRLARELEWYRKKCNESECVGSSVSVVGAVCLIGAGLATVFTGSIQPQHRRFCCGGNGCQIPHERHKPTKLPNHWNSMKAAGGRKIPNIIVFPLRIPKDGAWDAYLSLEAKYGEPEINRIVIPFILPGENGSSLGLPFHVITSKFSSLLSLTGYTATVHLAACLSKIPGQKLSEDYLKAQYACTIDETGMTCPENMLFSRDTNLYANLYKNLKAVFG